MFNRFGSEHPGHSVGLAIAIVAIGTILATPASIPALGCFSICVNPTGGKQFLQIVCLLGAGTISGIMIGDIATVPAVVVLAISTICLATRNQKMEVTLVVPERETTCCPEVPFNMIYQGPITRPLVVTAYALSAWI